MLQIVHKIIKMTQKVKKTDRTTLGAKGAEVVIELFIVSFS